MYNAWEKEQKRINAIIGFLAAIALARIGFMCFVAIKALQAIHELSNYDVVPGFMWEKVLHYGFWLMILAIAQIRVDVKK